MSLFGDIIGAGAGIVSGIINSNASSNASAAQAGAINQATQLSREMFAEQKAVRDRALARTSELATTLRSAMDAMGAFGGSYFDPNEVEAEAGRRLPRYIDAADRAARQIGSTAMADAITKGVDRSTYGVQLQREIQDNTTQLYEDAHDRAFDEALKYISGVKTELYRGQDQKAAQRSRQLGEINSVLGTPIQYETALIGNPAVPGGLLNTATAGAAQWNTTAAANARANSASTFQLLSRIASETGIDDWFRRTFDIGGSSGNGGTTPDNSFWNDIFGASA